MAELVEDTGIYPTMLELLEAVEAATAAENAPVDFASLQAGATPTLGRVGNGKTCSEAIINLQSSLPVSDFPNPVSVPGCAFELGYEVQVGVFRCAPMPTGSPPRIPSVLEDLEATRLHLADMVAIRQAICTTLKGSRLFLLRGFAPYGPEGGVVGGVWQVLIGPADG